MTKNQNDRFVALETQRHNYEMEENARESNEISRSHFERSDSEVQRHNLATEEIQTNANAINLGNLEESIRSHQAQEALGWANVNEVQRHNIVAENETQRHNQTVEAETNRTNVANERIRSTQAQASVMSANAALAQAAAASQNAVTNQQRLRQDYLNYTEGQRHNLEVEAIQGRQASAAETQATAAQLNSLTNARKGPTENYRNLAQASQAQANAQAVPQQTAQGWVNSVTGGFRNVAEGVSRIINSLPGISIGEN